MIEFDNVAVRAGGFRLDGVRFSVPAGGYGVLMGKTGSGKTTLIEALCGLRPPEGGRIRLGGRDVTEEAPAGRDIGYVPQDRALFGTLTVREHLSFSPRVRRWKAAEIEARVAELARQLHLEGLLDRRPAGLSGGEAQRVALGRALAARPSVLCLDEPLSALDDETRDGMVDLLRSLRQGVTILHVTHSREEARRLADRVLILRAGAIRELAPADLEAVG